MKQIFADFNTPNITIDCVFLVGTGRTGSARRRMQKWNNIFNCVHRKCVWYIDELACCSFQFLYDVIHEYVPPITLKRARSRILSHILFFSMTYSEVTNTTAHDKGTWLVWLQRDRNTFIQQVTCSNDTSTSEA